MDNVSSLSASSDEEILSSANVSGIDGDDDNLDAVIISNITHP
jgi:hypothetical protein